MNDLLKQLRATAERVGRCLEQEPKVRTLVVFGSVAYGAVTSRSDIDLWALCDPDIPEEGCRDRLLSEFTPNWKLNAFRFRNFYCSAIDLHKNVDGKEVSVHYQCVGWVETVITAVIERGAMGLDVCPQRPYTIPALVQRCRVIFDRDHHIQRWRQGVHKYPSALKTKILAKGLPKLEQEIQVVMSVADKTDGLREDASVVCLDRKKGSEKEMAVGVLRHRTIDDALDVAATVLFALNEIYDPNQRHLEATVLPELRKVPDHFLDRWIQIRSVGEIGCWDACVRLFPELAEDILSLARTD